MKLNETTRRLQATLILLSFGILQTACSHLPVGNGSKATGQSSRAHSQMKTPMEAQLDAASTLQGGATVVRIRLKDESIQDLQVSWNGKRVPALPWKGDPLVQLAVFGVPLDSEPGLTEVELSVRTPESRFALSLPLEVLERSVRSERLKVKRKYLGRASRGGSKQSKSRRTVSSSLSVSHEISEALWGDGGFMLPTPGRVTSGYGSQRVYNGGRLRSVHLGTDLNANTGDPVRVAAGGTVVSARRHLQTGNTIVVHHGFGIFTSYAHLSKIIVKVGEVIRDGTLIGLAGRTGRVTGSHLHWGASIRGVSIDPMVLLSKF